MAEVPPAIPARPEVLVVVVLPRLVDQRIANRAGAVRVEMHRVPRRGMLRRGALRVPDDEIAQGVVRDVRERVPLSAVRRGSRWIFDAPAVLERTARGVDLRPLDRRVGHERGGKSDRLRVVEGPAAVDRSRANLSVLGLDQARWAARARPRVRRALRQELSARLGPATAGTRQGSSRGVDRRRWRSGDEVDAVRGAGAAQVRDHEQRVFSRVGREREQRARARPGPGLTVVDHEIDSALEQPDVAVAVDRDRDPVLVEADDGEIEGEADREPVQEPASVGVAGLRDTQQNVPRTGRDGLHHRDPPVVVGIVERARIGEAVEGGFARRRPEGRRSHRADHGSVRLVEDTVVVVQPRHDFRRSYRSSAVGRDDDVEGVHHRDIVESDEARRRRRRRDLDRLGRLDGAGPHRGGLDRCGRKRRERLLRLLELLHHLGANLALPGTQQRFATSHLSEVHHRLPCRVDASCFRRSALCG